MNDTCLTEYRIRNALKNLQKAGLVSIKKKGLPAKNYYVLNEKNLLKLLEYHRTSAVKFDTTGNSNFDTTGSIKIDTTFNKNTDSKNTSKNTTYIYILDYLNEKAGTNYKHTSKATQKSINARLAEGYSTDDFKKVIDNQCSKWKGTEWEQYLRPSTLFGTKFENYLNGKVQNDYASSRDYSDLEGYF